MLGADDAPNAIISGEIDMRTTTRGPTLSLSRYLDEAEASIERFLQDTSSPQEGFVTWQDMVKLGELRGVTCVVKRPLTLSGLSVPIDSRWAIIVNKGQKPERQRFTLAHEIAHLFVTDEIKQEVWQKTPFGAIEAAKRVFERFCDDLASRILMPKFLLSKDLNGKPLDPTLLVNLAWKYGVSLRPFCIRAVELQKGAYHVAKWQRATNGTGRNEIHRRWRTASRGMVSLMPETTTLNSPVGALFTECLQHEDAEYGGDMVSQGKAVSLKIRASLLSLGEGASILTVAQRLKAPQRQESPIPACPIPT
jgi:Zn-dependent peptidase ImmA (M78 family)